MKIIKTIGPIVGGFTLLYFAAIAASALMAVFIVATIIGAIYFEVKKVLTR